MSASFKILPADFPGEMIQRVRHENEETLTFQNTLNGGWVGKTNLPHLTHLPEHTERGFGGEDELAALEVGEVTSVFSQHRGFS